MDLIVEKEGKILLIKRKDEPFKEMYALPGGYLECGKENLKQAGARELYEETNLRTNLENLFLVGVYSEPNRDPRGHVISHAYFVRDYTGDAKAGDDAKELAWFELDKLPKLAFDHDKIINDFLRLNGR